MIRSVTVVNHHGESLRMELARPQTSGFYIERIEGLGPSLSNINITERATLDGGYFSSAHTNTRNIVLSLGFWSTGDIEDKRHESYKYFPLKQRISLIIETDKRTCETHGYVESNDPNIFSSQETTQISILCPDPYFYAYGAGSTNVTELYGIVSEFEFPFSNESLIAPRLTLSANYDNSARNVYNWGDVDVGVIIHARALDEVKNPRLYNLTTGESMLINTNRLATLTGSALVANDEIVISTIKGSKSIQLIRNGVPTNILNCLDRYTDWIQLRTGANTFMYTAESGTENMMFKIENQIVYTGV